MVQEFWKGGYKYFSIDLGDGEARMCLSPAKASRINLDAYDVGMYPNGKVFYVDFLKVSPSYRNKGYGTILLKAAMKWASVSKNILILDAIPLDTGIEPHRLVRFYLSHGFKLSEHKHNKHSMYFHDRKTRKCSKMKPEYTLPRISVKIDTPLKTLLNTASQNWEIK